jgi:flagellar assembly factor FliW
MTTLATPTRTKEAPVATVTVNTLLKGTLEVPEDQIISFAAPLLGFEQLKRFVIYQTQEGPTYWLQSLEQRDVAFCLLAPFQAGLDPELEIAGVDVIDIGAKDAADLDVYTMVVLDKDPAQRRTNLRAPILVCRATRKAKQVVLQDQRLPIKFFLRDLKPAGR